MTTDAPARVVVLGAGALGCALGALLARGGHDVTLLFGRAERAERARRDGVEIVGPDAFAVHPRCTADPGHVRSTDVLLVAVKANQTAAALDGVAGMDVGCVASVQNGLLKDRTLTERYGEQRTVGAVVQVTARRLPSGAVSCPSVATSFVGPLGADPTAAERLAGVLRSAGLAVELRPDIRDVEWAKLGVWVPSSLLSVLSRLDYAAVMSDPALAREFVQMTRECAAIATATGGAVVPAAGLVAHTLLDGAVADAAERLRALGAQLGAGPMAGYRASMLLDVEAGRPPELDDTVGTLLALAEREDVAAPRLRLAFAAVQAAAGAAAAA